MNNSSGSPSVMRSLAPDTVAWSFAYSIVALMAIFGNFMVILAYARNLKLHTRTNYFVVSLASADLLVGIVAVPLYISLMLLYRQGTASPDALASVHLIVDIFGGFSSIFHLMLISLERFYAIVCPVNHRNSSRWMYMVSLGIVWVVSASLSVIHKSLRSNKKAFLIPILVCFAVAFVVICVAYVGIWKKARERRWKNSTSLTSKRRRRKQDQDVLIAMTVLIVIALFIFTWLPFVCINTLFYFRSPATNLNHDLIQFTKLLHYSNSAINPIIYSLKIPGFKKTFTSFLRRDSQRSFSRTFSFSRRDSRMRSTVPLTPREPTNERAPSP